MGGEIAPGAVACSCHQTVFVVDVAVTTSFLAVRFMLPHLRYRCGVLVNTDVLKAACKEKKN
jgi:hypothetical protein